LTAGPIDYLAQVDFGAGRSFKIEYKPLSDNSVYTKGVGAAYPKVDLQNAAYVVSRKLAGDGRGAYVATAYSYAGLRADLQRNGNLGFEQVTNVNEVSGLAVTTTYRQDHPFIGLPVETRKYVGAQNLEHSAFSYQAFELTAQYARLVQTEVTTRHWDLNGAFVSWVKKIESDFDAYGNPRAQVINNYDSSGVSVVWSCPRRT